MNVVYFVSAEDLGQVKIGYTSNLSIRFNSLSCAHKGRRRLVGWMKGGRKKEAALHRRFQSKRVHDEWFQWDDELREFAHRHLIRHVALTVGGWSVYPIEKHLGIDPSPDALTTREAAIRIGVGADDVRLMIRSGLIKAEKFGQDWRIDPRHMDALFTNQTATVHRSRKRA